MRDFPCLLREHGTTPPHSPLAKYGVEVGDGWEPVVRRLAEKLEPIARETGMHAVRVQEKFCRLDFLVFVRDANGGRSIPASVHTAIRAATKESGHVCNTCGAPGDRRPVGSRLVTLCESCLERARALHVSRLSM